MVISFSSTSSWPRRRAISCMVCSCWLIRSSETLLSALLSRRVVTSFVSASTLARRSRMARRASSSSKTPADACIAKLASASTRAVLADLIMFGTLSEKKTGQRSITCAVPSYPWDGCVLPGLLVDDIGTAVLRPCFLVVTFGFRLFLAQRNGFDLAFWHAQGGQRLAHGFGAFLAQGQGVFGAAAFVGVALNQDLAVAVLGQVAGVVFHHWLAVFTHDVAVEVEVHAAVGQHAFRIVQRVDRLGFHRCDGAGLFRRGGRFGRLAFHHRCWLGNLHRRRASGEQGCTADDEGEMFYITHFISPGRCERFLTTFTS